MPLTFNEIEYKDLKPNNLYLVELESTNGKRYFASAEYVDTGLGMRLRSVLFYRKFDKSTVKKIYEYPN